MYLFSCLKNFIKKVLWNLLGNQYWVYLKNQKSLYLNDFKNAKIGKYTYNNGAIVWQWGEKSELVIGNYCSIAHQVQFILDSGHHDLFKLTSFPIIQQFYEPKEELTYKGKKVTRNNIRKEYPWNKKGIHIGHDVWIGANSIILPNVNIGNGCIIMAGAVVTKSFDDFSIIAGVPAEKIGVKIAEEYQKEFSSIGWWYWEKEKVKLHIEDFNLEVSEFILKHKNPI